MDKKMWKKPSLINISEGIRAGNSPIATESVVVTGPRGVVTGTFVPTTTTPAS